MTKPSGRETWEPIWKVEDKHGKFFPMELYPIRRENPSMVYYAASKAEALALAMTLNNAARMQNNW